VAVKPARAGLNKQKLKTELLFQIGFQFFVRASGFRIGSPLGLLCFLYEYHLQQIESLYTAMNCLF
jgi:hypothetical protein